MPWKADLCGPDSFILWFPVGFQGVGVGGVGYQQESEGQSRVKLALVRPKCESLLKFYALGSSHALLNRNIEEEPRNSIEGSGEAS